MDRRTFLHHGCLACIAGLAAPLLLDSCSSSQAVAALLEGDELAVPVTAFEDGKRKAVVVTHPRLERPIALFRTAEGHRAVLMRCTHKGVELRLAGDRLECDAHGSSFDSVGAVLEGPANKPLRVLPTVEREGRILISLKA